jgi:hypothetical protein
MKAARELVQSLRSVVSNDEQFAGLHAKLTVARDDVWLNHQRHSGRQDEFWRGQRPTQARNDRRQISTAEAMHEVVNRREASLVDAGRSGRKIPGPRARYQPCCDGVEGGGGHSMQFSNQRRRRRLPCSVRSWV